MPNLQHNYDAMANTDFELKDRAAGRKAASGLRLSLQSKIKSIFKKRSGAMEKSTVTSRMKNHRLDRLILASPRYSFQKHFGSTLTGTTPETSRKETNVNSFERYVNGKSVTISAHKRSGSKVAAHVKGIDYKATNHIAAALKAGKPVLETLATELGENRIVEITSQIDF